MLPGVRCWCWPHCQCSGDIDLLATLGPVLQFPAPPLRCHSNGCLCAEMSRNGTKPDNFQWHTDTERYIAAHCQAAASKLGLKRVRKLYLCNTSDLSGITTLNDSVKNKSQPKVPLDQIEPFVSRVESILLPSPASSPVQQHQPPTSSLLTSNF